MFAKDVQLLNEIYSRKIFKEDTVDYSGSDNTGERIGYISGGQQTSTVIPPVRECNCGCGGTCNNEDPAEDCEYCDRMAEEEDCESCEESSNAQMARQDLYRLTKLSAMLHDIVAKSDHIEPWVLTKISDAKESIEAAYGYEDYKQFKTEVESVPTNIEEETEADLYNSINIGGLNLINFLRKLLATESKEVLETVIYETVTALEARK